METQVQELSAKKQGYKEARTRLKALSEHVRADVGDNKKFQSVNIAIAEMIYREEGHEVLKPFYEWKKDGKSVIKGAKALVLWGSPKQSKPKPSAEGEQANQYDYWPIVYLFSDKQVA